MNQRIVLDSFALVSLFHKEQGWKKVSDIFHELSASGEKAALCLINWGEFYYIAMRRVGQRKAQEALALLEQLPIEIIPVDTRLVRDAAEIKAKHPVAYADAFCIATAKRLDGQVLTNDPEFRAIGDLIPIIWLTGK